MQKCSLISTGENSVAPDTSKGTSLSLSVSVEHCGISHVSLSTLQNIWKKAQDLLQSKGSVLKAPWLPGDKAKLVKSTSSAHPHVVQTHGKENKLYCCDSNCHMYKGFSLCSHVIAAAEHNNELKPFLDCLKDCGKLNLTAIANEGLPKGAGRKGGMPK